MGHIAYGRMTLVGVFARRHTKRFVLLEQTPPPPRKNGSPLPPPRIDLRVLPPTQYTGAIGSGKSTYRISREIDPCVFCLDTFEALLMFDGEDIFCFDRMHHSRGTLASAAEYKRVFILT